MSSADDSEADTTSNDELRKLIIRWRETGFDMYDHSPDRVVRAKGRERADLADELQQLIRGDSGRRSSQVSIQEREMSEKQIRECPNCGEPLT